MRQIIQLPKIHWYAMAALLFIAGFALSSCNSTGNDDDDDAPSTIEYSGDFIASADTISTSASGTTTATYNPETGEVSFEVEWTGLSSPVIDMHFHDAGPVIHGIEGWDAATSGSVSGTVTFSADEAADLAAGMVYTQIHTEMYPGGEVIAPLTPSSSSSNTNGDNNNNNNNNDDDGGGRYNY